VVPGERPAALDGGDDRGAEALSQRHQRRTGGADDTTAGPQHQPGRSRQRLGHEDMTDAGHLEAQTTASPPGISVGVL
jgi:hypothetical protein